ncbi:MAG: HAD-IC family P-type ATPase, partial [Actinobacteria bacterium]|nr:HAD-IC family P-type ATPase [Actinomycetota bacterium]
MRTGEAFQTLRLVQTVVLDKTGTLTDGKMVVRELEPTGDLDELLLAAAAAEAPSEHPLANAVIDAALDRGLPVADPTDFQSHTGLGVEATVAHSTVLVGRPSFVAARGVDLATLDARIQELEQIGRTVIVASADGCALGIIALADQLRADAIQTVAAIRALGLTPVLVTGDNDRAARHFAREAGIEHVHAAARPEQKAQIIRRLQQHGRVAMVGDGINDAPALMQSDVGIAMGGGTDIAMESADIIIIGDRLQAVLTAREISRASYRKIKQNVTLAFLFNGIGVPLATTGLVHPVWAMIAMALSVTGLFVNSLWGRPSLLFDAIRSVGRPIASQPPASAAA